MVSKMGCEEGLLRDITRHGRYFLVNVLKIVNGRKPLRFKTLVRQQMHRKTTEWGRVLAATHGMLPYYPRGSSALKTK